MWIHCEIRVAVLWKHVKAEIQKADGNPVDGSTVLELKVGATYAEQMIRATYVVRMRSDE